MSTHITINGQTYPSVEAMPPEVRREYEVALSLLADRNGNGIPDLLEGKGISVTRDDHGLIHKELVSGASTRIFVNGKEYSSLEEVPAAMRQALENAWKKSGMQPGLKIVRTGKSVRLPGFSFSSEEGVKFGLGVVIVLVVAAVVGGILIARLVLR
jgi:hypothetical protein